MISYEDFSKLEFKVGKVLEVEEHPNADKLYVLKVDIGTEVVQIVAGVKKHYSPDELKGKQVVVLVNLEPKPLRGVESKGMVLAAQAEDKLAVVTIDREIAVGGIVK
ncbi:MAG: methionine--tRNA ligase subunit beta [Candidatus Omnitrophota bacterium]|nr:methionine--tRNA ligase subunit beta [Candidatus Omnitrophota bacterium]